MIWISLSSALLFTMIAFLSAPSSMLSSNIANPSPPHYTPSIAFPPRTSTSEVKELSHYGYPSTPAQFPLPPESLSFLPNQECSTLPFTIFAHHPFLNFQEFPNSFLLSLTSFLSVKFSPRYRYFWRRTFSHLCFFLSWFQLWKGNCHKFPRPNFLMRAGFRYTSAGWRLTPQTEAINF